MSLRDQLLAVRAQYGALTPTNVVDAARPPEHPLHDRFEWDDTIAGEKYRAVQAGELIRSVQIVFRQTDGTRASVRDFHSVERGGQHEYITVGEVVHDPIASKVVLADMRRDWLAFKTRYSHMVEFVKLLEEEVGAASAA